MARIEVGFVTAAAVFAAGIAEDRQREGMRKFVSAEDEGSLKQEYIDRFTSECDLALQRLLRQRNVKVKTLRAEDGYAWPEYHKGWLRYGCDLTVEPDELKPAIEALLNPEFAGSYDASLESAASDFVTAHLAPELFDEVSVTFHVAAQTPDA